jgi:hypothetical protein
VVSIFDQAFAGVVVGLVTLKAAAAAAAWGLCSRATSRPQAVEPCILNFENEYDFDEISYRIRVYCVYIADQLISFHFLDCLSFLFSTITTGVILARMGG